MKRSSLVIGLALFCTQAFASTDLVVIVNPASGIDRMSRDEITWVFMGRTKKLPNGITALPIDLSDGNDKAGFYMELVNKGLIEIRSYWARLIFSGKGSPPQQADNAAEVLEIVGGNKGAIGYVPRGSVDKRVKIILDMSSR